MNRALAETLSFLNGLIAIFIVIGGAAWGFFGWNMSAVGLVVGAASGFIVAALTCGVISYLALIEGHLAKLAGDRGADELGDRLSARKEPSL